ncbi:MAG: transglutaminase domain-containing protein [Geminicoccaceae bacterium]
MPVAAAAVAGVLLGAPARLTEPFQDLAPVRALGGTYVKDKPGRDIWQKPDRTASRTVGDCEDWAILLRDRLRGSGLLSRLRLGRLRPGLTGLDTWHVWLEVKDAGTGRRFLLDTFGRWDGGAEHPLYQQENHHLPGLIEQRLGADWGHLAEWR